MDIEQMLCYIKSVIKGEEPSVDILLGFKPKWNPEDKEMGKTFEELRATRRKVSEMRNYLWDQYATKYSSECNIQ